MTEPPTTITVLHAGVFENLLDTAFVAAVEQADGITLKTVKGPAVQLANSIKAGTLTGDLFMSADASVNNLLIGPGNGDWVSWFVAFASNEIVLAYSETSTFAAQFEQARSGAIPWYEVLGSPGLALGRDDPNVDPLGYYDLFVGQLAELHYGIAGLKQRILGDDDNPSQVLKTDPSLLTSGKLDAEFMYLNKARDAGLLYITFPDQVNLSNPDLAGFYSAASYTTKLGQIFRGAPIRGSIAPLRGGNVAAAIETICLLTSPQGAGLLDRFRFLPSPLLAGGDIDDIPPVLRAQVEGAYQSA